MADSPDIDLDRFLQAQKYSYDRAKREMEAGHKQSCWIWFIFPQILINKTGVSPTTSRTRSTPSRRLRRT
jgi:uncharacterized protein (DUF1810 family)